MSLTNFSLIDFPDCLLLNLLKYLDSTTLYVLTKVHDKFETLILDPSLWKRIDARKHPNTSEKNDYCIARLNNNTSLFCLKGASCTIPILRDFCNLKILALEDQIFGAGISLNCFPSSLTELSFKNSTILQSAIFFKKTSETMKNLKILLLDCCTSLDSSVVMSVSKYPSLETISFYKCKIENSIPYFSIAAWHGFKKLKVMDVRLSGLGKTFLRTMTKLSKLSALYFQNNNGSYVTDFNRRKIELDALGEGNSVPNIKLIESIHVDDDDDRLITDEELSEFKQLTSSEEQFYQPQSFLYKDPYGQCNCLNKKSKHQSVFEDYRAVEEVPLNGGLKRKMNPDEECTSSTKHRKLSKEDEDPQKKNYADCGEVPSRENHVESSVISVSLRENLNMEPFLSVRYNAIRIPEIARHSSIKRLSLRGYPGVSDRTLSSLESLNLELLDVTYTKVTEKGIEDYLSTNSNCRVVHENFCTCQPLLHF